MARPLRYVPADSLVEVTCRTLHGRFLLRPDRLHRSPAPRFHAQAWRVRKSLELAYHDFRLRFRQAAGVHDRARGSRHMDVLRHPAIV